MNCSIKKFCLRVFALLFAAIWLFPAMPARADDADDIFNSVAEAPSKMEISTPEHIAMVFSRLTGLEPDFDYWARHTPAYKAASGFDKNSVAEATIRDMRDAYNLLTLKEPLVIRTPVLLSSYSTVNKGFLIQSFRPDTYFPAKYMEKYYAIIPKGIMDSQWMKVERPEDAKVIEDAAAADKDRILQMVIQMTPVAADGSSPVKIDKANYWLIAAEITNMFLYSTDGRTLLWQSDGGGKNETTRALLDLYQ